MQVLWAWHLQLIDIVHIGSKTRFILKPCCTWMTLTDTDKKTKKLRRWFNFVLPNISASLTHIKYLLDHSKGRRTRHPTIGKNMNTPQIKGTAWEAQTHGNLGLRKTPGRGSFDLNQTSHTFFCLAHGLPGEIWLCSWCSLTMINKHNFRDHWRVPLVFYINYWSLFNVLRANPSAGQIQIVKCLG